MTNPWLKSRLDAIDRIPGWHCWWIDLRDYGGDEHDRALAASLVAGGPAFRQGLAQRLLEQDRIYRHKI